MDARDGADAQLQLDPRRPARAAAQRSGRRGSSRTAPAASPCSWTTARRSTGPTPAASSRTSSGSSRRSGPPREAATASHRLERVEPDVRRRHRQRDGPLVRPARPAPRGTGERRLRLHGCSRDRAAGGDRADGAEEPTGGSTSASTSTCSGPSTSTASRTWTSKLKALDIDTIVIVGLWTDECVLSTAYAGNSRGYDVVVVGDAVATATAQPRDGVDGRQRHRRQGALDRRGAQLPGDDFVTGEPGAVKGTGHPDGRKVG
jgi:hypothetical protein